MILQKSGNKIRVFKDSYITVNIFLAGVILLIMLYSGIFSPLTDNYPVSCVHEKFTGEPCASCGLSHSFSLILRGHFTEAAEWNIYGMRVFLFFALQLVLRVAFSIYYVKNPGTGRKLIVYDSAGSGIMFLITFGPYIRWLISGFHD